MKFYKITFTEEELAAIHNLVNDESKHGNAVIVDNPEATILIEEWKKELKVYKSILMKIQEVVDEDN